MIYQFEVSGGIDWYYYWWSSNEPWQQDLKEILERQGFHQWSNDYRFSPVYKSTHKRIQDLCKPYIESISLRRCCSWTSEEWRLDVLISVGITWVIDKAHCLSFILFLPISTFLFLASQHVSMVRCLSVDSAKSATYKRTLYSLR